MRRYVPILFIFLFLAGQALATSIFLKDHLEEGESKVYETSEGSYIVKLVSVSDVENKALFEVNQERSSSIRKGDSFQFEDQSEIILMQLLINDASTGADEATYYFYGSGEKPLKVWNISRASFGKSACNFDGICGNEEASQKCCFDCSCEFGGVCSNNTCTYPEGLPEEALDIVGKEPSEAISLTPGEKKTKSAARALTLVALVVIFSLAYTVYRTRKRRF